MTSDRQLTDEWVALEGVRIAPNEAVDTVINGSPIDLFLSLGAFIAGFFVAGARAARATPEFNPSTGVVRAGRKRLAMSDISRARLLVHANQLEHGEVDLCFGLPGKLELAVLLSDKNGVVAPAGTRAMLAEALAGSSIGIPRDPYDPKGRFARSGSPHNVTKQEAIALVRNPPMPGDPLPIIQ